jgi:branched-chain amino acid transport system permease protein
MSACVAALGGNLYAHTFRTLFPEYFGMNMSVLLLLMIILGGTKSLFGPVIGAIIVSLGFEVLRSFKDYQMILYGVGIVLITMYMPNGIVGGLKSLMRMVVGNVQKKDAIST